MKVQKEMTQRGGTEAALKPREFVGPQACQVSSVILHVRFNCHHFGSESMLPAVTHCLVTWHAKNGSG